MAATLATSLALRVAHAQEPISSTQPAGPVNTEAGTDNEALSEVVITGTLLRGIAPTGTNVVTVSSEDVLASGATNANQVLAHIPQVTTAFNTTPTPQSGPLASIARPDIRRLNGSVGSFGAGGNATLVLIDGHRIVGAGTTFETPDPDVIPTAVLERVEVVPDGGSSIYGSDAIGGVINFITKKQFEGVQASVRRGAASDYHSVDASLTAGTSWGDSSLFASYSYVDHDAIYGRDRGYARSLLPNSGACFPGTVSVTRAGTATTYALPNLTPNAISVCDVSDGVTLYPSERRHSIFAGFTQEFSSRVQLDVRGFYTDRNLTTAQDPNQRNFIALNQAITPANPFYRPIDPDPGSQAVSFSYAAVADPNGATDLTEWGVTPTLTFDVGNGWEVRFLGNYGHSDTAAYELAINAPGQSAALRGTTTATALNPYDLATTNPDVLANILAVNYQESAQKMLNGRLTVDGPLFQLPGGDIKIALGSEWTRHNVDRGGAPTLLRRDFERGDYSTLLRSSSERTLKSVFAELSIPIVGRENARPGIQELTLSASGRYDHYSDFGSTTNPKFGFTYKPVDSVTLRGNYGTSFTAPALVDMVTVGSLQNVLPFSPFRRSDATAGDALRPTIFVLGGNPRLKPQEADTYSFGVDFRPKFAEGLALSATYYNISFKNQIAFVNFQGPDLFAPYYSDYVVLNPTQAQVQAVRDQVQVLAGAPSVASLYSGSTTPYVMIDTRKANLGQIKVDGLDLDVSYQLPTSFGSLYARAAGTYTLDRKFAPSATATFTDQRRSPGFSRFALTTSVGATIGKASAELSWNHSAGYDISPAVTYAGGANPPGGTQSQVGSFDVFDLFVSYEVPAQGLLSDTRLTLTLNNLYDAEPPFYGGSDVGFTNGSTLGRLVQIGLTKKF